MFVLLKSYTLNANLSVTRPPPKRKSQADASLGMLEREYLRESLSYVLAIQDVQERIKFEFVETLLSFMSGWMVFYHWGHDTAVEAREYMTDLQHKVQKTRENFDETQAKAEELKSKYMDSKMKPDTDFTKQGYLFLMEKSKLSKCGYWNCVVVCEQRLDSRIYFVHFTQRPSPPPGPSTIARTRSSRNSLPCRRTIKCPAAPRWTGNA